MSTNQTPKSETTEKKEKKKKKYKKCVVCKKRNFMNTKCKCGKVTCLTHRHAASHKCDFDWQKEGRDKLEDELVHAIPNKLPENV